MRLRAINGSVEFALSDVGDERVRSIPFYSDALSGNQAFFKRLRVDVDRVEDAELVDEIEVLLSMKTKKRQEGERSRVPVLSGVGSNNDHLVDLRGVEPLTSCLPSKRSTN